MLLNQKTFVAHIMQYFDHLYDKMAVTYILNHPSLDNFINGVLFLPFA